ncbi:hypothetical protein L6452_42270 [Arctium lappa]|uniref:Uncharacterized protein n=1 Tax=Arctium lappa TaxID=4217 RepID=A0ACB8XIY7_ARCLA|nr:hypothetical protein L6452_42270 [Arctium lappa]
MESDYKQHSLSFKTELEAQRRRRGLCTKERTGDVFYKMKVNIRNKSKYRRCSRALARFLNKARDIYVKSMSELADHLESGCGPAAANVSTFPSVSSTRLSSSNQELAELMRLASRRGLAKKVELEFLKQQRSEQGAARLNVVKHSRRTVMGKISEDKACDFDEVDGLNFNLPEAEAMK